MNDDELSNSNPGLKAIWRLNQKEINNNDDIKDCLLQTLYEVMELTRSEYGLIYTYLDNSEVATLFCCSKNLEEELKSRPKGAIDFFNGKKDVLKKMMLEQKGQINNNFIQNDNLKINICESEGQDLLDYLLKLNFISYPFKIVNNPTTNSEKFFIIIVGSKDTKYSENELFQLTLILDIVWKNIERMQMAHELKISENNLKTTLEELKHAMNVANWANKAKSIFFSNMGHEIRTPLNSIIGMSSLLNETTLTEDQTKYVSSINKAGDTLLSLINNVLDISKIESGSLNLESVSFDIKELLDTVVDIMTFKAQEKGILLKLELSSNLKVNRVGDPLRIKQILINLVQNAIKFTSKGEIVLKVEDIEDSEDIDKDNGESSDGSKDFILFIIKDSGIGIAEDRLHLLFKRFQQVDSSTTRKYGGTGLGLNISRELTKLMNGEIWVESKVDVGTTFYVKIPLKVDEHLKTTKYQSQCNTQTLEALRKHQEMFELNILLADDSEDNQMLFEMYFKNTPCKLEIVDNGEKALEEFKKRKYDIVLMDISMPVMDGYTATKMIREYEINNKLKRTPIVALTAFALSNEKQNCYDAGCDYHLSKPIKKEDLLNSIKKICNKEVNK
ncbi:MAG: response regulator [Oligoflexia bacterium]|nr:response regulator [Oligoflexia bacterium]